MKKSILFAVSLMFAVLATFIVTDIGEAFAVPPRTVRITFTGTNVAPSSGVVRVQNCGSNMDFAVRAARIVRSQIYGTLTNIGTNGTYRVYLRDQAVAAPASGTIPASTIQGTLLGTVSPSANTATVNSVQNGLNLYVGNPGADRQKVCLVLDIAATPTVSSIDVTADLVVEDITNGT